jgi:hypothetical protein
LEKLNWTAWRGLLGHALQSRQIIAGEVHESLFASAAQWFVLFEAPELTQSGCQCQTHDKLARPIRTQQLRLLEHGLRAFACFSGG